jgi:peptide/nickel transport system permease protein
MTNAALQRARLYGSIYARNPAALLAGLLLLVIAGLSIAAPLIASYPPLLTNAGPSFAPPSMAYPMGTDDLGRDIFSGVLYGGRVTLGVGLVAGLASVLFGTLVGLLAGFLGGVVDLVVTKLTEVFLIIPAVFLAILLVTFFGSSIINVIITLAVVSWPVTSRLVRAQVLSLKEREFCKAARVLGESSARIMFVELLPNTLAPVIVNGSIQVANAIVVEAGLSFLGLSDQNYMSWGTLLFRAQRFLTQDAWWTFIFPGAALFCTVLCLNVVADMLNHLLNPRTRYQ